MKRVRGVTTVRGGIGQRFDHLMKLDHRAWPAMRNDQRHRPWMARAHVDEVSVQSVELGCELGEAVEPRLAAPPIVLLGPVLADLLDPFERRALAQVVDEFGFRPTGVAKSRL